MLPCFSAWLLPLTAGDCSQGKRLLQEQGWKAPALDMAAVKETQRWQLPASSPASVCKSRQKALWGEQAAFYFIFQNTFLTPAPTRPSYPALDGNWMSWALNMTRAWMFSCKHKNSTQQRRWIDIQQVFPKTKQLLMILEISLYTNFLFYAIDEECQYLVDFRAHFLSLIPWWTRHLWHLCDWIQPKMFISCSNM